MPELIPTLLANSIQANHGAPSLVSRTGAAAGWIVCRDRIRGVSSHAVQAIAPLRDESGLPPTERIIGPGGRCRENRAHVQTVGSPCGAGSRCAECPKPSLGSRSVDVHGAGTPSCGSCASHGFLRASPSPTP